MRFHHLLCNHYQQRDGFRELPVLIGVSVRHLHLCLEHIAILFGEGHDLQIYNELYQKGYYAAKEQVMVVGRKRCIEKVRVLGPPRPYSQVELAQTDALSIGLKLPIALMVGVLWGGTILSGFAFNLALMTLF